MGLQPSNRSCLPGLCCECFDKNVVANTLAEKVKQEEALKVKPQSVSWCTWYQKIASTVGISFDGSVISGREALQNWKSMADEDRDAWKASFRQWSGSCSPSPKKKNKFAQSLESPEKVDPPAKRLPDMAGPQPNYDGTVSSLQEFHKRWSWLKKKMGPEPSSSFFLKHSQEYHELYLDVLAMLKGGLFAGFLAMEWTTCFPSAALVSTGLFFFRGFEGLFFWSNHGLNSGSFTKAEEALKDYKVNRLKMGKLHAWVADLRDAGSVRWAPQQFSAGRRGSGFLTIPQKKDLLRHCVAMASSNRALFPREVKQAMFKMYLHNTSVVNLEALGNAELPWRDFDAYLPSLDHVYKDWRLWVRDNFPDRLKLINQKSQYKSHEEAASITPETVNQHFDALEQLLVELKLMDASTMCLTDDAGNRIWTFDEKGLSGDAGSHVKNVRAVSTREVGATRSHKPASFGHITLCPFVNLAGGCASPVVCVKGASTMKAWAEVWKEAVVIATENGSMTTSWFSQILGLFGRYVREDLKIPSASPVLLQLDSGGGGQLHISAEASLVAEVFNIRLFFFRKYMTAAVCSLDQDPNRQAEAKFHEIRSTGYEMNALGALHAAREASRTCSSNFLCW